MSLRIALIGAVGSTERALLALAQCGHPPLLLLTLPPDKSARHSDYVDLRPLAERVGTPVVDAPDVNRPDIVARLSSLDLDLLMVIGWSRICGPEVVAIPRLGTLGYHPALLPAMRGRAALAWTILLNPPRTGGTLFWIDDGVDSGPIAAQQAFPLHGTETLGELMERQLDALSAMLPPLLQELAQGSRPAREQNDADATYLALRRPEDGEIDWNLPAGDIERLIRAVSKPYPGAFTSLQGKKLIIWSATTGAFPEWYALPGQVFTHQDGRPVVRCGANSDLILIDFEMDGQEGASPRLTAQPRLGRRS